MFRRTLYIQTFNELCRPVTGAILFLLGLVWLMQSTRFLDLILNKGFSILVFLNLTAFLVPFLLQFILPLGFFVGIVAYLKRINDESELAALLSAGLSPWKILRPVFLVSFGMVALGYALSLIIMPISMTNFKDMQYRLRNEQGHIFLETGTFNQLGNGLMVYLKQRIGQFDMRGILVHDSRNATAPTTWIAKSGQISISSGGTPKLSLQNGLRQDITQDQVTMLEFDTHTLELAFAVPELKTRSREVEEFTLPELGKNLQTYQGKKWRETLSEWHRRLLWPLTPLVFTLIAAAALLQPKIRRHGVVRPVAYAGVAAVLYQLLLIFCASLIQNGTLAVAHAQWALPFLFSMLAIYILNRSCKVS